MQDTLKRSRISFLDVPLAAMVNVNVEVLLWSGIILFTALTRFWGDESWKDAAYHPSLQEDLFGEIGFDKLSNGAVVAAFRARLRDVAGFRNVPEPIPMKNRMGSDIYYLFFASQNDTANKIVNDIFRRAGTNG